MNLLVYTSTADGDLPHRLGAPEYSYRFVLREFLPLLRQLGTVIEIARPELEVDPIYHACRARGEDCFFLCFMPPNKVPLGLACPTIPVFAWEYDTLPDEPFNGKPRNDWRRVLSLVGAALTHSSYTVERVRAALGSTFPVTSVPAPLWDRMQSLRSPASSERVVLNTEGLVIDSRKVDLARYSKSALQSAQPGEVELPAACTDGIKQVTLEGTVFTSVFNPGDGRKNWRLMILAFCEALRDRPDATLLLKLTHHDRLLLAPEILETIYRAGPMAGRVVLMNAYLAQHDYELLLKGTTFALNASHGEGQCLPLMEYMSAGKVAIAPRHTSMADYIDENCAFIVDSSPELGAWPHDPRQAFRTTRQRIHYQSLVSAFRCAYYVARHEPEVHAAMSRAAVESQRRYCSMEVVRSRLLASLEGLAERRVA